MQRGARRRKPVGVSTQGTYDVVDAFHETLSGDEQNRPAMTALLEYLRKHKKEGRVVIIDDISRFARWAT
jgi:hypothetical protein